MVDKVKPLKMESSATGGVENDYSPTEVDPSEDYVATKGIAFENLDTVYIKKDGNDIKFKDLTLTTEYSANQLRTAVNNSFDNATNGFVSSNVQAAIEEAKSTAQAARYGTAFGFDGGASTGRWLETLTNVASNVAGHVVAESAVIKSMSVACTSSATFTITLYKNGVALDTLVITSARKGKKSPLNHTLAALDELSAQVTSGSCSRPVFNVFIKVTG